MPSSDSGAAGALERNQVYFGQATGTGAAAASAEIINKIVNAPFGASAPDSGGIACRCSCRGNSNML